MLVKNWRQVLKRAWSVRLLLAAGFFSGAEVFLPLIDGYVDMPRGLFAAMSGLSAAGAFVSRFLAQKDLPHADQ